jgi:hypothetical protein
MLEGFLKLTKETKDGKYRKGYLGFVTEIGTSYEKYSNRKYEDFRFEKPGIFRILII